MEILECLPEQQFFFDSFVIHAILGVLFSYLFESNLSIDCLSPILSLDLVNTY